MASGLSTRTEEPVKIFLHVSIIRHVITQKTNNMQNISAQMAMREPAQIPHTILTAGENAEFVEETLDVRCGVLIRCPFLP